MNNILYIITNFIILPLAFIFLSFFKKDKIKYLIIGLLLLSLHSFVNLILYINIDIEKSFDSAITNFILAFLFLYITSKISNDKSKFSSYNYMRKVILYGFGIYYLFEHIPLLRGIVILIISCFSVIFARVMGFNCGISGIDYAGYSLFWQEKLNIVGGNIMEVNVPISSTNIGIVLGCTGLREILLLYFFIKLTDVDYKLQRKTFLIGAFTLLIANILRNTIVIYYTGYKNLPFEFTHHTIGSILIFIALLFVVIYTLFKIPQINSYIEEIFGLKKIKEI